MGKNLLTIELVNANLNANQLDKANMQKER